MNHPQLVNRVIHTVPRMLLRSCNGGERTPFLPHRGRNFEADARVSPVGFYCQGNDMAEALLADLSAGGYRATAQKLRRLAAIARLPEARDELAMIAESFERLALKEEGPDRFRRSGGDRRPAEQSAQADRELVEAL
jgi:hypothetical protein